MGTTNSDGIVATDDRGSRYDYRLKSAAKKRLRQFVPKRKPDTFDASPEELNVRLRVELSPLLKAGAESSLSLAEWIIRDWGGITGGVDDAPRKWMEALGAFEDETISNFIVNNGTNRISSWSKLLAFADSENHAIYDALTSVALNCALRGSGDKRRFYMPAGKNNLITEARLRLRRLDREQNGETDPIGYREYIELLTAFKMSKLAPSLLRAEMTVYANATQIAHEFLG
ncbi:MAG: hypothetical protein IVW54_06005 [Candidatus Binataceae bacterium]|nr:hypothetical protein [Candidatus Binataceae bacterium]